MKNLIVFLAVIMMGDSFVHSQSTTNIDSIVQGFNQEQYIAWIDSLNANPPELDIPYFEMFMLISSPQTIIGHTLYEEEFEQISKDVVLGIKPLDYLYCDLCTWVKFYCMNKGIDEYKTVKMFYHLYAYYKNNKRCKGLQLFETFKDRSYVGNELAKIYLTENALIGNPQAMYLLARCTAEGCYFEKDSLASILWLHEMKDIPWTFEMAEKEGFSYLECSQKDITVSNSKTASLQKKVINRQDTKAFDKLYAFANSDMEQLTLLLFQLETMEQSDTGYRLYKFLRDWYFLRGLKMDIIVEDLSRVFLRRSCFLKYEPALNELSVTPSYYLEVPFE